MQLIPEKTNIDFVAWRRVAAGVSSLAIVASIALFVFVGPRWGIDFTGGTEIQLRFQQFTLRCEQQLTASDLQAAFGALEEAPGLQVEATENAAFLISGWPADTKSKQLRSLAAQAMGGVAGAETCKAEIEGVPVAIDEVRGAIGSVGLPDDAVQQVGGSDSGEYAIRVQDAAFGSDDLREAVQRDLASAFGADWIQEERFEAEVGATMTIVHGGPTVPMEEIKGALASLAEREELSVQEAPDDNTFYVKLPGLSAQVAKALGQVLGQRDFEILSVDSVGPRVGGDLRRQGFISIFATLALVLAYVAFRFDITFAPGAIVALFHDVTIVIGIFVLLRREVNISIIGALLTIIGYSLNDTIVIYDRIRENVGRYRRRDMAGLINTSVNETLNRTVNTSLTTFAAIAIFLFMGGPVIQTFALAMCIGVVVGTYSTVFVASPLILVMQDIKPHLLGLMTASMRGSPEQAAGKDKAGARERRGRSQPGSLSKKTEDGKPRSERDLFKNT